MIVFMTMLILDEDHDGGYDNHDDNIKYDDDGTRHDDGNSGYVNDYI